MSIGFLFWLLFLLYVLFGGYFSFNRTSDRGFWLGGYGFILFMLFLIGWKLFGFPIQG